jgi:hypothetical protein
MATLHFTCNSMNLKPLITLCSSLLSVLAPSYLLAQQTTLALQRTANVEVLDEENNAFSFPWTGGFNFNQVSACDLNNDNVKDLVIFDRSGNRLILLNFNGTSENPSWQHNIDAEPLFPKCENFLLMRDFNCDGREDIFTYSNSGIKVYKNEGFSGSGPQFSLYTPQLRSSYNSLMVDVYNLPVDIPSIDDIDGDGDLDFLVFNLLGSCVEYHRNMAQEQLGRCDTLVLRFESDNWGRFTESFSTNEVTLNDTCNSFGGGRYDIRHAGSSIASFDADGDGDKELLLGDIAYRTLTKLINGGTPTNAQITDQVGEYPDNSVAVNLAIFPAAYFVDINQDGKRDLIVSPNSASGSENYRCFLYYKNEGAENQPVFNFQNNTLFSAQTLDFGEGSIPHFFDYNADGKKDIIVGNYGYFLPTGDYKTQLALLENTSTAEQIGFKLVNRNYTTAGTLAGIAVNFHPTTGDLDGDGDADLLLGASDGRLYEYENTALPGNPANFVFADPFFEDIDAGTYSAPCIVDLDQDGKQDLLIGTREGTIQFYRNTTNGSSPVMELQTLNFGNISTALPGESNGFCTPFVFRKNGLFYLICGSSSGVIRLFGPVDLTSGATFPQLDSVILGDRLGIRTSIALNDLDDDGNPEAVVGNYSGGLLFYKGIFPTWMASSNDEVEFNIYPNPGTDQITIDYADVLPAMVSVYDVSGRLFFNKPLDATRKVTDMPSAPGVYFIKIQSRNETRCQKWIRK